jgi:hypothetical protein
MHAIRSSLAARVESIPLKSHIDAHASRLVIERYGRCEWLQLR